MKQQTQGCLAYRIDQKWADSLAGGTGGHKRELPALSHALTVPACACVLRACARQSVQRWCLAPKDGSGLAGEEIFSSLTKALTRPLGKSRPAPQPLSLLVLRSTLMGLSSI